MAVLASGPVALSATMHRFAVELSDVDRGVYETLDIRAAQHPSESRRFLLARVIAYCLYYETGIEFGRGVSNADEPAIWIRDLTGRTRVWIDVGRPSVERLHRASKTGAKVVVIAHEDPRFIVRDLEKNPVHRQEELEVVVLPSSILESLEPQLARTEAWAMTVNDGTLYLLRGDEGLEGVIEHVRVGSGEDRV
jgi:uncharacterized protein YaeQ